MFVENKSDSKFYHFPNRLRRRLEMTRDHPVTIVEAPSGFGKTTAVREYLKKILSPARDLKAVWHIAGEENRMSEWEILCGAMRNIDGDLGGELGKLSVPYNDDDLPRIRNILHRADITEETFLVIDNYQFVQDRIPPKYAEFFFHSMPPKLHLVLMTQLGNPVSSAITGDAAVNHIQKEYLHFTAGDIRAYYKLYNLRISKEQAEEIYQFTEGWIAAIYLTLLQYEEDGNFNNASDVAKLMETTVWNRLLADEQQFLLRMNRFDSFDIEQAKFMNETDRIDKNILNMLRGNGFVYFRPEERRYFVHGILQACVRREFEMAAQSFQNHILSRTGQWYESQCQNFLALKYYNAIGDFDALLKIDLSSADFTLRASEENRALLISVLDRCPKALLLEHPKALLVFAFTLFIYNEKDRLLALCDEVQKLLVDVEKLTEVEKNRLSGELVFLRAFLAHNDFAKMAAGYRQAYELLGGATSIINRRGPWTFGAPSVFYMFYRENAQADTACLEENLQWYLKVANGHGTGADLVMRGELQLNQGRLQEAEITAHRAVYKTDEHDQLNLGLGAYFLLVQIAVARGDTAAYGHYMESLREKAEDSKQLVYLTMLDLCLGFLFAVTDGAIPCPDWLKTKETISRVRFMTRPYADIIVSKSLLLSKEYAKLIGVGEELRKKAADYPNVLAEIYIGIHLALAHEAMGNAKSAEEMLKTVLRPALPDEIYMPFAQNYEALEPIVARVEEVGEEDRRRILELHNMWRGGVDALKAAVMPILSDREREVALLVLQGLTNPEIADKLFISRETVKSLLNRAFKKTETQSRTELSAWLLQHRDVMRQWEGA